MKPVVWAVNFIRSHALIHRFLKEIDAEYSLLITSRQRGRVIKAPSS